MFFDNFDMNILFFGYVVVCVGFDFVCNVDNVVIEVFVKLQDGFRIMLILYFSGQVFLVVVFFIKDSDEYLYLVELEYENMKFFLIDGVSEDIGLFIYFKINDFKFEGYRFL